ncbi:hypothetical protein HAX54_004539 [Datura stramonium]|uniref:K-box domain-containing protein n=1 Tax=Datura stramonium TaxID=4076 RepID=A0ABS8WVC6_DATST|nr:hypothetical protein [Datura stramonium]
MDRAMIMVMKQKIAELSSQVEAVEARERLRDEQYAGLMKVELDTLLAIGAFPIPPCPGILQRYESHVEAEKEISAEIQVAEHSKYSRFMTMGELLQTTERQLEETNADGLAVTDLIHLENELQTALIQIRSRKTHLMLESVKGLHQKEKLLREENKLLEDNMARIKKNRKVNEMSDLPPPHIIRRQQRVPLNFL